MVRRINLQLFFLFAVVLRIGLINLSWFSFFALLISIYQFALLFNATNEYLPVRYLFGSLMCLQMLIGPMLAFNGLDAFQEGFFRMQVPEETYFSYVLPAVIFFIFGLNIYARDLPGEKPDIKGIEYIVRNNIEVAYVLIVIGFLSSFVSIYFGNELAFFFVLLAGLRFVGLFMIILGAKGVKPFTLFLVYGSIFLSSIAAGMFHDLIVWLIFLVIFFSIKYKPSVPVKVSLFLLLLGFVVVVQQLKSDYREATWRRGEEGSVETVAKTFQESKKKRDPFSAESFAKSNLRINQGYIITNIMVTVPSRVSHENGNELLQILEAAFLPRLIAPNKLQAGDRDIFMKYTGIFLDKGTSMGLSSVGDAYINFGIWGGWVFMFFYGLFFNLVLKMFKKVGVNYPLLILFSTVIFYYPIRPDCEMQTILGHLVKATFIVFVMLNVWKANFWYSPVKR